MQAPRDTSSTQRADGRGAPSVSQAVARGKQASVRFRRLKPVRAFSHFTDVGGNVLAGGMSYQALFAVFAGLWVGFGVLGIVLRGNPDVLTTIVKQLNTFIPGLVGDNGVVQLDELLGARVLNWTSLLAALSLVWVALNWFTGTRRSIRLIFELEVKEYRNPLLLKLRDLVLALAFFAAIIVSTALTVFSSNLANTILAWLGADPDTWFLGTVGTLVRHAALLGFDVLLLYAVHRYLAEVNVPRWHILRGCMLGGIALLALKIVGGIILGGTSNNPLLASFAVIIGLLLWFNIVCRILLLTAAWIAVGESSTRGLPDSD